jgi:hypothetical protein
VAKSTVAGTAVGLADASDRVDANAETTSTAQAARNRARRVTSIKIARVRTRRGERSREATASVAA